MPEAVARIPAAMAVHADDLRIAAYEHSGVVTVPGAAVGWGASWCTWGTPAGVTRYRHKRDRAVWQQAARVLRAQPGEMAVLYVIHEQVEERGRTVWAAVRIRQESEE